jgi:hypothetical protein
MAGAPGISGRSPWPRWPFLRSRAQSLLCKGRQRASPASPTSLPGTPGVGRRCPASLWLRSKGSLRQGTREVLHDRGISVPGPPLYQRTTRGPLRIEMTLPRATTGRTARPSGLEGLRCPVRPFAQWGLGRELRARLRRPMSPMPGPGEPYDPASSLRRDCIGAWCIPISCRLTTAGKSRRGKASRGAVHRRQGLASRR